MRGKRLSRKEELEAKREAKRDAWRGFAVQFGVYIVMAIGVLGSQALKMRRDLSVDLSIITGGQIIGSFIVAGAAYNKLESEGEFDQKKLHVFRLLRNALYHGFFWSSVIGGWWG